MEKFKFKHDIYRNSRGNYSKFLNLYCDHCGAHLLLYQKDGPGPLKRIYLDRIFAPDEIAQLQNVEDVKNIPQLVCKACQRLIGIPAVFEKEKRNAYLLLSYAFIKVPGKGIYPPEITRLDVK